MISILKLREPLWIICFYNLISIKIPTPKYWLVLVLWTLNYIPGNRSDRQNHEMEGISTVNFKF